VNKLTNSTGKPARRSSRFAGGAAYDSFVSGLVSARGRADGLRELCAGSAANGYHPDQMKSYAYVVERAEDGSYWAYLPDLPGCTTSADSPEEIEPKLREAVDLYVGYHRDRGEPAPPARARVGHLPAA
jgi:predicted RNase H-like HicB family nuclease